MEERWIGVCASSSRVPDDSDSKSGVIKQRQNCLESQRVEGQELPVLALAPCAGKQELGVNQVRRRFYSTDVFLPSRAAPNVARRSRSEATSRPSQLERTGNGIRNLAPEIFKFRHPR